MENTDTNQGYRILAVDDDALVLVSIKMFLQERGYLVDTAQDSSEALALFTERPYDYAALLVDYQMPGTLNGPSLIRELLKIAPEAGIFAYSGAGTAAAVQATWNAGAVGFITKGDHETLLLQLDGQCRRFEETRVLPAKISARSEDIKNTESIRSIGMVGRSSGLAQVADQVSRYRKYRSSGLCLAIRVPARSSSLVHCHSIRMVARADVFSRLTVQPLQIATS